MNYSLQTNMKHTPHFLLGLIFIVTLNGCSTAYKAAPVSFKSPSSLGNSIIIDGAIIGAKAYDDDKEAAQAFGFDTIGSGILPVQVVFDNRSKHTFEINGEQSFLEDNAGNLWPVLSREMAYDRASQDTQNDQMFKKGTSGGLMGATAGALIGSAIGIVTRTNVGAAAVQGAAVGGTIGAIAGGIDGHQTRDNHQSISQDLREKSLQNKTILPDTIAYGILFFPAESSAVANLQLRLVETDTGKSHQLKFDLTPDKKKYRSRK